jgi:hypothetical protein
MKKEKARRRMETQERPTQAVDQSGFCSTLIGLKISRWKHGATIWAHHHIKPSKFLVHKSKVDLKAQPGYQKKAAQATSVKLGSRPYFFNITSKRNQTKDMNRKKNDIPT